VNSKFDKDYFVGATKSAYNDYSSCVGVLNTYSKMLDDLFSPSSVFDAGCAYGFVPNWFNKNKCIKASGCDISEFAAGFSELCYVSGLTKIPEDSESFELVTCTEVLEHIEEKDVVSVISELYRISKKYVVMLVAMFPEGTSHDPGDSTHITLHARTRWCNVINDSGYMRNINCENALNNHSYSKSIGWVDRFIVIEK